MNINIHMNRLSRPKIFEWGHDLNTLEKVIVSFTFACLIGLLAQLRFYLPWTPIPITGQTFAVLLGAVILGKTWGGASSAIYVGMGAAGVPWFSGWSGGLHAITGATGGYLLGFVISAFFVGYVVDTYSGSRGFVGMLALMLFTNFVLIYGFGMIHLYFWLSVVGGTSVGLLELLMMGAIPFVLGDIVKVFISSSTANWLTPKKSNLICSK